MSKYVNLATGTNYAMRMNRLSNRIFGEVIKPTNQKSIKVKLFSEKPVNERPEIVEYYPRYKETELLMSHLRDYGLFRDEHKDFKEEYQRLRENFVMCANNTQAGKKNDRQLAGTSDDDKDNDDDEDNGSTTFAAMLFDRDHRSMDAWYFICSICFFSESLSMVQRIHWDPWLKPHPPCRKSRMGWRMRLQENQ